MADRVAVVRATGRPRWVNPLLEVLFVGAVAGMRSVMWCVCVAVIWVFLTGLRVTSPHPALPAGEQVDGVRLGDAAPSELAALLASSSRLADTKVFVSRAEPVAAWSSSSGVVLGWHLVTSQHAAAVLAHELGHVAGRDWVRTGMWMSVPSLVLAGAAVSTAVGVSPTVVLASSMVSMWLLSLCAAAARRRRELAADRFAAHAVGADAVADMLRSWCASETPSWFAAHPPLRARLAALEPTRTPAALAASW